MKAILKVWLLLLLVSGLLLGFASLGTGEGLLRIGASWPTYIDPAVGSDASSTVSLINLYDTLVYPKEDGSMVPHAAESWEVSADGLHYTFKIRPGIRFHDGTELTADDIKFSMDRLLAIGEGYSYLFRGMIGSTEVLTPYTIQFNLQKPFGPFISSLVRFYILNKEEVLANIKGGPYGEFGDYGKEYLSAHDCGSGPYMVREVRTDEYVLMDRFANYWGEIDPHAPDEVKILKSPDPVTVRTLMKRRELEITDASEPMESYEAMRQMEGIEVASFSNTGDCHYVMLNTQKPPTDDIYFRKALSWLFDYERLVTTIFPGAVQARGPVSPAVAGAKADLFQYHQDLEKAREELRKSKYYQQLDAITVTFGINSDVPAQQKVGLMLQADAAQLGIDIQLINMPWATIVDVAADKEKTPNLLYIAVGASYPEAGSVLMAKYSSATAGTWEQTEWLESRFIDQLIDDALTTTDREERFAKYGVLQEIAVTAAFDIFVCSSINLHAYQADYVDWPQAEHQIPVAGYELDCRFIQVLPEKSP